MSSLHYPRSSSRPSSAKAVRGAWERFVHGEDDIRGVRPEVAISWHRCRDQYHVDPHLTEAPLAVANARHSLDHDVVFAELGFRAASMAHELANVGGVVTIADAGGRVLAQWGDRETRAVAAAAGLAPWFCWSESSVGTNGMGTALSTQAPVMVRREEHWCEAFHEWTCAGVAVRDVVSREPIAALDISCWQSDLPASASTWLLNAASQTQTTLRTRARDGGKVLLAEYHVARGRTTDPLVAVDTAGKVVIADERAGILLGVPSHTPAVDPAVRWKPQLPSFVHAAKFATEQAERDRTWVGSTQIFTHLADEPSPIGLTPVFHYGNLVGHVIAFGVADGDQVEVGDPAGSISGLGKPRRVVGVRENRIVPLRLPEVVLAEAEGTDVWLSTDQGRLRAATPGIDKFDQEVAGSGFLRVHRRCVVNIDRVKEVERLDKGTMTLVMDDAEGTMVPVSRRNARSVRTALGI